MRRLALALLLGFAACKNGQVKCEQVAKRLMPNPTPDFIAACRANVDSDAAYEKMVDCLLAVPGGLYEKDIASCPGHERLPVYFQF